MNLRTVISLLLCIVLLSACARAMVQEPGQEQRSPELGPTRAVMADGTRLPLSSWLPDGEPSTVVLALHGFNDFSASFESLGLELAGHGIAVYAYDQRGFGATAQRGIWAGEQRLVDDARAVTELLRQRHPDSPLYLVGESMGAAVTMLALTAEPALPVSGAVLLAPAVWARETQPWYQRSALWLGVRLMPGTRLTREWVDIEPTDDPEVMEYWDTHPLVIRRTRVDALEGVTRLMDAALAAAPELHGPLLVLYGGEDEVVPPTAVCAMLNRLPPSEAADWRFAYYPEGWHLLTRDSRAAETKADILAWLQRNPAALPSGRERGASGAREAVCDG